MTDSLEFVTTSEDAGQRLDIILAHRLQRSRTACAQLIRGGRVLVNGRPAKPASIVEARQRVVVDVPPLVDSSAQPQDIPIRLVHDEADFAVVDKPAGMATHPSRGNLDGTLVNALLAKLGPLPAINGVRRPGIVHRLDKDTSGLLVIAKTDRAMSALTHAMAQRRIKRSYDALVWGIPTNPRGVIEAPIGRDPHARTKFAVREDGRRAVTHYQVVEAFSRIMPADKAAPACAALLRVELETGRTHQIRVHCAAIGHPIIGDEVYGPAYSGVIMKRQALHAAGLAFTHPFTGEHLRFRAPWPDDFASLVSRLHAGGAP
jgi:23S rRNA pseudouridine1911/1915/1917 synthase